jgi:hypothetical protein
LKKKDQIKNTKYFIPDKDTILREKRERDAKEEELKQKGPTIRRRFVEETKQVAYTD